MKTEKTNKNFTTTTEQIKDVDAVQLENVTGGCAACGMANCTMGAAPNQFARRFWR
jgi:hypothetical protein